MSRLANQNLVDADPPAWVEFLLHSHPSISKRVAMARSFFSANEWRELATIVNGPVARPSQSFLMKHSALLIP